jgi:hypothetical protein
MAPSRQIPPVTTTPSVGGQPTAGTREASSVVLEQLAATVTLTVTTALVELPAAQVAASTAEQTEEAVGGRCVRGYRETDC